MGLRFKAGLKQVYAQVNADIVERPARRYDRLHPGQSPRSLILHSFSGDHATARRRDRGDSDIIPLNDPDIHRWCPDTNFEIPEGVGDAAHHLGFRVRASREVL